MLHVTQFHHRYGLYIPREGNRRIRGVSSGMCCLASTSEVVGCPWLGDDYFPSRTESVVGTSGRVPLRKATGERDLGTLVPFCILGPGNPKSGAPFFFLNNDICECPCLWRLCGEQIVLACVLIISVEKSWVCIVLTCGALMVLS